MKIYIPFLAVILAAVLIQSCDKIEAPYRESNGGVTGANDTVIISGDTIAFGADTQTAVKKVLAEDYTGHLCGNCPYAGLMLNDTLKQIYQNQLVVISVHAGFFAGVCPSSPACAGNAPAGSFTTDYTCQASNDWNNFFGITSNPNGMIDRKDYPSSNIKGSDAWHANIQTESVLAPECKLRIINHYNASTRELKTAVRTELLANSSDAVKLQLVLTEDSITDWQEWYPPHVIQFDSAYVHHHVLRGGINGSFGQQIAPSGTPAGSIYLDGFSFSVDASWNASRCSVVAFLYNAADYRVLQTEELRIQ